MTTEERIAQIANNFGQGFQNFQAGQEKQRAVALADEARRRQEALQAMEVANTLGQQSGRVVDPAAIQPFLRSGDLTGLSEILGSQPMRQKQIDPMQAIEMKYKQAQIDEMSRPFSETREAAKMRYASGLSTSADIKKMTYDQQKKLAAKQESLKAVNAPGYELALDGDVIPSKPEAKDFRSAISDASAFKKNIDNVAKVISDNEGVPSATFNPNVHNKMRQEITKAMLDLKGEAFFKLGVLAGPDMQLIEKTFGEIDSTLGTYQPDSAKIALEKLRSVQAYVDNKLAAKAASLGYQKKDNGPVYDPSLNRSNAKMTSVQQMAPYSPNAPILPSIPSPISSAIAAPSVHPETQAALQWAQQNPRDPRAQEIFKRAGQ